MVEERRKEMKGSFNSSPYSVTTQGDQTASRGPGLIWSCSHYLTNKPKTLNQPSAYLCCCPPLSSHHCNLPSLWDKHCEQSPAFLSPIAPSHFLLSISPFQHSSQVILFLHPSHLPNGTHTAPAPPPFNSPVFSATAQDVRVGGQS